MRSADKHPHRLKFVLLIAVSAGAVLFMQAGYFALILHSQPVIPRADAIIVFNGASARVKAGYDLAKQDMADSLVVSPANSKQVAIYRKEYALAQEIQQPLEENARTTFENALLTCEIIASNDLRTVILVTHRHHMPRSLLLLRLACWRSGVNIHYFSVGYATMPSKATRAKMFYNEMVETWGSLGEFALYKLRGHLPKTPNSENRGLNFLKSLFLFNLKLQETGGAICAG